MRSFQTKKLFSIILILLGFLFPLYSSPVITFEKLVHDFGNIKEEDGRVEYDFIFTNDGDKPLKLIKVKTS